MASRRPDLAQYPTGFTILRIFQAVLSIITIVVTSFTIHAIVLPGNALLTVASSITLIVSLWGAFAHLSFSRWFSFRAAFGLDAILTLLWGISIAVLGAQTSIMWMYGSDYCESHECPENLRSISRFYAYVFAICFGLGVIGFIFACATLVFHGVVSCRSHKYNQIGTNKEAVPVIVTPEHPQESTSYQGAAGYQSLA
ncbi:hypothetical protein LB507_006137 [Fusarium sp. FIESC RH6]|nr:hypothetical protein LB507_006137 [Fusarium sp. FIESC RH6]